MNADEREWGSDLKDRALPVFPSVFICVHLRFHSPELRVFVSSCSTVGYPAFAL
jgi:hypothetical protein